MSTSRGSRGHGTSHNDLPGIVMGGLQQRRALREHADEANGYHSSRAPASDFGCVLEEQLLHSGEEEAGKLPQRRGW